MRIKVVSIPNIAEDVSRRYLRGYNNGDDKTLYNRKNVKNEISLELQSFLTNEKLVRKTKFAKKKEIYQK